MLRCLPPHPSLVPPLCLASCPEPHAEPEAWPPAAYLPSPLGRAPGISNLMCAKRPPDRVPLPEHVPWSPLTASGFQNLPVPAFLPSCHSTSSHQQTPASSLLKVFQSALPAPFLGLPPCPGRTAQPSPSCAPLLASPAALCSHLSSRRHPVPRLPAALLWAPHSHLGVLMICPSPLDHLAACPPPPSLHCFLFLEQSTRDPLKGLCAYSFPFWKLLPYTSAWPVHSLPSDLYHLLREAFLD